MLSERIWRRDHGIAETEAAKFLADLVHVADVDLRNARRHRQMTSSGQGDHGRTLWLIGLSLATVMLLSILLLAPDATGLLAGARWRYPAEWLAVGVGFVYEVTRRSAASGRGGEHIARTIDTVAGRALAGGLAWVVGAACVALLATWVPHYLTWPWFRDLDTFATIAQSWDAGILPYRHIRAYNFPGQVYVLWILGKAVGWGHTAAFYAVDVGFVLALGIALITWSRRRLNGPLPGLIGYLAFLARYLSLDYSQVAQRDWQATCLIVLALLALQVWSGREGRVPSALLTAFAFAFRPHVALFLPAILSAVDENARRADESAGTTVRAFSEWSMIFLIGVVVAFAPLILAGVVPDFVSGLRVAAYSGPYSQNNPGRALGAFVEELGIGWTFCLLAVGPLLAIFGPPRMRRLCRTWGLAMLAVLLYKPLHPVQHAYLFRPLELTSSVVVALLVAWIVASRSLARPIALAAVLVIACEVLPAVPQYCSISESLRAFKPLFHHEEPTRPPIGAHNWFDPADVDYPGYRWTDYRGVLSYLREKTTPHTVVANVLRRFPFPPVNAPAGRLSPFLVESGICWMWLIDEDLDAPFARALERATDSVVVWVPNEIGVERRMKLEQVAAAVRRNYHFEARFGRIEIWRRTTRATDDR